MAEAENHIVSFLKDHKIRITAQRVMIMKTLLKLKSHSTVEDVHQQLPGISMGTLYNNLKLFVSLGILQELPYGNGLTRYELYKPDHYHVMCELCGWIADFNYPSLKEIEAAASDLTSYKIKSHHLEFYGVCPKCQNHLNEPNGNIRKHQRR